MSKNKKKTWICKPSKGAQGDGLQLINEIWEVSDLIKRDEYIIQEYLEKPLWVNKKKFDLRLYIVLFGVDPMYAYLCDEGMARFWTVNYEAPSAKNKKNEFMHLSNYSINKHSEDYVKNNKQTEDQATKRKLSSIYKTIEQEKTNGAEIVKTIKDNISNVCRKTVNAIHPFIKNNLEWEFKSASDIKLSLFHIVGIDIMIDQNYNVWVLEINNSPSMNIMFETGYMGSEEEVELSEIDKEIKLPLVSDAFCLANKYRKDHMSLNEIDEYNSLYKIYTNTIKGCDTEFDVAHNIKTIYDLLTGTKGKTALTSSQFTKLYTLSKFLKLGKAVKHDMAVIFASIVGRCKSMMSFMDFNNAMVKLFNKFVDPSSEISGKLDFPTFLRNIVEEL